MSGEMRKKTRGNKMKERRRLREKETSECYMRYADHINVCVGA